MLNKAEALRHAEQFMAQGKTSSAIAVYKKIVEADPYDLTAICTLGDLYTKSDRISDAIADYSRIADSFYQRGSSVKASYILRKILELDPANVSALSKLSELESRERANSPNKRESGPTRTDGLRNATETEIRPAAPPPTPRSLSSQTASSSPVREPMPDQQPARLSRPVTTRLPGPAVEPAQVPANATTGPAEEFDERSVIKHISKAELLVGYGQVQEAISMLNEVLKHKPNNIDVHIKLKDVYLRSEMIDEAGHECLEIARIYAAQGDSDRAKDFIVRAQRLAQTRRQTSQFPVPDILQNVGGSSGTAAQSNSDVTTDSAVTGTQDSGRRLDIPANFAAPNTQTLGEAAVENRTEAVPGTLLSGEASAAESIKNAGSTAVDTVSQQYPIPPLSNEFGDAFLNQLKTGELEAPHAETTRDDVTGTRRKWWYVAAAALLIALAGTAYFVGAPMYEAKLDREFRVLASTIETPPVPDAAEPSLDDSSALDQIDINAADAGSTEERTITPEPDRKEKKNELPAPASNSSSTPAESIASRKPGAPLPPTVGLVSGAQGDPGSPRGLSSLPNAGGATEPPPPPRVEPKRSSVIIRGESVRQVQPIYPLAARATRQSGSVTVEITINEAGDVVGARATSGPALFREAAVAAARRWKFKPALRDGKPVSCVGTISFNFKM